jgi:hypothetical protein
MNYDYQIKPGETQEQQRLIFRVLETLLPCRQDEQDFVRNRYVFVIDVAAKCFSGNDVFKSVFGTIVTLDELIKILGPGKKYCDPVALGSIDGYAVTATSAGLVVGCQTLPFSRVREIAEACAKFEAQTK